MNKYNIKTLEMLDKVIFLREIELHEQEQKIKNNFGDLRDHFPSYFKESVSCKSEYSNERKNGFFSQFFENLVDRALKKMKEF